MLNNMTFIRHKLTFFFFCKSQQLAKFTCEGFVDITLQGSIGVWDPLVNQARNILGRVRDDDCLQIELHIYNGSKSEQPDIGNDGKVDDGLKDSRPRADALHLREKEKKMEERIIGSKRG